VAIVTGARVKIGYRITLKLLRCGAAVAGGGVLANKPSTDDVESTKNKLKSAQKRGHG
jgi:NAD(P)-dependent dehydrogenase (short-subunit alcohol dehydrogenase family)